VLGAWFQKCCGFRVARGAPMAADRKIRPAMPAPRPLSSSKVICPVATWAHLYLGTGQLGRAARSGDRAAQHGLPRRRRTDQLQPTGPATSHMPGWQSQTRWSRERAGVSQPAGSPGAPWFVKIAAGWLLYDHGTG
jgi:hypothetical protein